MREAPNRKHDSSATAGSPVVEGATSAGEVSCTNRSLSVLRLDTSRWSKWLDLKSRNKLLKHLYIIYNILLARSVGYVEKVSLSKTAIIPVV